MKILYILSHKIYDNNSSGVVNKVISQGKVWEQLGHEVSILSLFDFNLYNSSLEIKRKFLKSSIPIKNTFLSKFSRLLIRPFRLKEVLAQLDYDIIYSRALLFSPGLILAFKNEIVVVELNSLDIREYRHHSKALYLYNLMTRNFFYRLANGFVAVTEEIKDYYSPFGKKTLVLGNGIDFEMVQGDTHKPAPFGVDSQKPAVCFVGSSGCLWHGVDLILEIAKQLPEVNFYFIGIEGQGHQNVKYLGQFSHEELLGAIPSFDVGFCSLGYFQNKMKDACTLKSRLYLASGVPIVYAYNDPDLQGNEKFALKVESSRNLISENLNQIKTFIFDCYQNSLIGQEAKAFAKENLDYEVKEVKRVEFFKDFCQK